MSELAPRQAPLHVAIIMDGNGRWAKARGLPRQAGHRAGAETIRRILEACPGLGVHWLTLYAFSTENWSRPADEVTALMKPMPPANPSTPSMRLNALTSTI